ncbi:MAG: flagellar hook-basal body complex protein [Rhodobiaceae bacterium]|nr:flagellar hook-basal body complex protein [Rhodobiaceae bacterium]MCC0016856.1 flagellar hook-basal body complex protein [Rhodobiaceae bacterium]
MGIYGAMGIAVGGLKAQSYALEQISSNIANSQTTGYKRIDTSFVDLVTDSPYWQQAGGSVQVYSRGTNTVQGDISNASVGTYMALNGDGFFIVDQQTGESDGAPIFSGVNAYTRRGDFEIDANGYLVNGAGYFLKGFPVDSTTGNISGSLPQAMELSNDFLQANPTTEIKYRANLADYPLTANADPDVANSELLDAADFANDPTTSGTLATDGYIQASDETTFLESSISGGAITVYDQGGGPVNVQLRWAKVASTQNGDPADNWNMFYLSDSTATGTNAMWTNVGQDYTFDSSGQLSPAVTSVTLTGLTIDGSSIGDVTLNHGTAGLTQFADANGNAEVTELSQDGYAAGELVGVSISETGRVVASYTNGRSIDLYQVAVAKFNATNRLAKLDGGAYAETQDSGPPIVDTEARIIGSALENSNTDIADEFTKLITTQQAYAAGTRIVTTSDEMLQEVLNMVR